MGWYPFIEIDSKTTGEQVMRLQERMQELNYYTHEITGKYDKNTSSAFAEFMKAQDLKPGKTVSVENQELLFSDEAIVKPTPTPMPTPTPKPTYEKTTYSDLLRQSVEVGAMVSISGRVLQCVEDDGMTAIRLATKDKYGDVVLVTADSSILKRSPRENRKITVNGAAGGVTYYKSVSEKYVVLPLIIADEILLK